MHSISLQSSDSSISVNDILGRIGFAASNETGSDALKVSALILAVAEDTFGASSNPTSLTFSTGHSETATEKMRIDSVGNVGINILDPQVLLHVGHDNNAAGIRVEDTTTGTYLEIGESAYTASDSYTGITHSEYTGGQEYMLLSAGTHTYMSAKTGYGSYIRSGANGTSYELYIGPNEASIGTNALRVTASECVLNEAAGNRDFRVETENLTHAIYAHANKDEVVIYNAVGYGLNYATSEGWTESTESQTGYYGGDFVRNGGNGENSCEFGDLPNGMRSLIWKTRNNTTDSGADGGWNKDIEGLDPEKTYISIVYVRRVGSNTDGQFWHGCGASGQTETLAGVSSTNPYFHGSIPISNLPQDVWCVSIGIIHAHSDPVTTSTGVGGLYRLDTGARITLPNHTDFRMGQSTTTQRHRTYLFYDATGDSKLDWCWPGFYDVTSPEIVNFLNTILYDHASNIDITDFNASSIITESEGISSNDNDTTLPTSAAVKDYVDNNSGAGNTSLGSVSVTSNQTVFNTSDTFTSSNLAVFLNGVKLVDGTDYNVTSSSQFTLTSTAVSGDVVEYIAYGSTVASSNLAKTGDTMTGNLTVNADLIVTGYKETHTDNGNTGTAQTIDISDSTLQTYTLNGNCTFTMPTADAGRSFTVFLKTGAGSLTATFTGVKFPSNTAPTITTTASRMDIITFYSDGTNWYGSIQQEYHV